MKVAKLVLWSPMVRVIVEDTATEDEIEEAARDKIRAMLMYEFVDNIEAILDDEELPYDPEND